MASIIVPSRKREPYETLTCPHCRGAIEFLRPTSSAFQIKCVLCDALIDASASSSVAGAGSKPIPPKKGRRIGTDAQPLDTAYYDILGVPIDADLQAIKSAYRRLAIKLHPDKNPNDPEAAEKFKQLALAYSTLSDPQLRKRYNEFGSQQAQQAEGFVDPEAIFSQLFGGERFASIIGTISLGQEMKSALQQAEDEEGDAPSEPGVVKKRKDMTPEEKAAKAELDRKNADQRAKARAERVNELEKNLIQKLAIYTEQAPHPDVDHSVRVIWKIEADELKQESYGVELLQAVGHVYCSKARHFAASNSTPLGIGGWFHGVRSTAHVFSETVSTLRSAYELTDVFKELNAAEAKGLTAEQKKVLEEKAAQKAMLALFKGAKLEVDSVVREVCDRLLEANLPHEILARRAGGLEILGQVYMSVRKDDQDDSDYVRVDAKPPVPPRRPVPPTPSGPPPAHETHRPYKPYTPSRP